MKRFTLTILCLGLGLAAVILPSGLPGNAPPVAASLASGQTDIAGPAGSGQFGKNVLALPNGNIVVTDPYYDDGEATDAGAVYLYNGATATLISTLTGSNNNDQVGSGGVTELANGNYVVLSPNWNNDGTADAGAATWGDGTTGVSGAVSLSNSLVGTTSSDQVGSGGATALTNGNYVVLSPYWNNGTTADVGAATWGHGTTGISGAVSASNSLVGTRASDRVGQSVTALTNGNYVVVSTLWDNGTVADAGAATWGSGTTGITGPVTTANSLVGSATGDQVGWTDAGGVTALTNGNYVVGSILWDNGTAMDAGAATWGDGTTGITGVVSTTNSLVGSTGEDYLGASGVAALSNGNYVVSSPDWHSAGAVCAGAATWGDGTTGITGVVTTTNSLVGSTANDAVGYEVTALANGNYVIASPYWNGTAVEVGAVTWGNGTSGTTGVVSTTNSLVGGTSYDYVALPGVTPLANGNYVVASRYWHNDTTAYAGAVTWANGTTGTIGLVSSNNSLVGGTAYDYVGSEGVTPLSNGNYVVLSPEWHNLAAASAGAATWGNGTSGTSGPVSASNSLVGGTAYDYVGSEGVKPLANGNYVVLSPAWNGTVADAGAATWGNGTTGTSGPVSASNSLVGTTVSDQVGSNRGTALTNGHYVFHSASWDNGGTANAGAVTWVNGWLGPRGTITAENSVRGTAAGGGNSMVFDYDYTNDQLVVGRPADNIVTLFKPAEYETFVPLVLKKAT